VSDSKDTLPNNSTENKTEAQAKLQNDEILQTENNMLKEQIKEYDDVLTQTVNLVEQKTQENAKLIENNQILETALKNFIK
jgi:hypothetical protein